MTFVDTPGVLSGEKQRTQRSYDFTGVTSWFAAKCDLILLLFDPHKLDISDEFKRVIGSLRGHDDKIRIVLNKADQVDAQQASVIFPITAIMPFFSLSLSASQHIPFSCCCSAICMHVCSRNRSATPAGSNISYLVLSFEVTLIPQLYSLLTLLISGCQSF